MRLSFVTLATFAVALSLSSVVKAEGAESAVTDVAAQAQDALDSLDADGNAIQFIETTGDHDFDDDDDDEVKPVRRSNKHKHRSNKSSSKVRTSSRMTTKSKHAKMINGATRITWYASNDLKNPQCGTNGWTPTNNAHIGAVMAGWENGPKCGEFVYLCNDQIKNNNCLQVRVIDKCAGCKANHVDLTKSAFKQLDPKHSLDTGVVKNLKLYSAGGKPNPWDKGLFGPLRLANKN